MLADAKKINDKRDYPQIFKDKFTKGTVFAIGSVINARELSHLKLDDVLGWKLIHLNGDRAILCGGSEIKGIAPANATPAEQVAYIMDGYNIENYEVYEYEIDGEVYGMPIINIHGCERKPYIWHTNVVYNFDLNKFVEIPFRNYTS